MSTPSSTICSLLPSATEIVFALGLGDRLLRSLMSATSRLRRPDSPSSHAVPSILPRPILATISTRTSSRHYMAEAASICSIKTSFTGSRLI